MFCTGTLHLFNESILKGIFSQIFRVLKPKGKLFFDFATNIKREKRDGSFIRFCQEPCYDTQRAKNVIGRLLQGFDIEFIESKVLPEELELEGVKYTFSCDFLIVIAKKKC